MRIYTILEESPELWQGGFVNYKEVARVAHDYVCDLFKMDRERQPQVFMQDFKEIVRTIAICNPDKYERCIEDFRGIGESEGDRKAVERQEEAIMVLGQYIVRYLKEYGFVLEKKDLESYAGRGKKLLSELMKPDATQAGEKPFDGFPDNKHLDQETAKAIFKRLHDNGYIECDDEDFIWYFCDSEYRRIEPKPDNKIKWIGETKKDFAYLCECLTIRLNGKKTYLQADIDSVRADGAREEHNKIMASALMGKGDKESMVRYEEPYKFAIPWECFKSVFAARFGMDNLAQSRKNDIPDKIIKCVFGEG